MPASGGSTAPLGGGTAVWTLGLTESAPVFLRLAEDLLRAGIGDYPCCQLSWTVARMHTLLGHSADAAAAFDRAGTTERTASVHSARWPTMTRPLRSFALAGVRLRRNLSRGQPLDRRG